MLVDVNNKVVAKVFLVFDVKKMEFGVFFFLPAPDPDVSHDLCVWVNFNFIFSISRLWHPLQMTAPGLNPSCVNSPASYWSFTESSLCPQPKPQPWIPWRQIEHGCCGLEGSLLLNGMGPLGQPHRDGLLPQDGILFGTDRKRSRGQN